MRALLKKIILWALLDGPTPQAASEELDALAKQLKG